MGGSPEPGAEPAAPESVTADPEPTAEAEVEEALPLPEPIAPPPEIEDADDGDVRSSTLKAMRDDGDFVVALLGYPTAGKTWFLNRLKKFCVSTRL